MGPGRVKRGVRSLDAKTGSDLRERLPVINWHRDV